MNAIDRLRYALTPPALRWRSGQAGQRIRLKILDLPVELDDTMPDDEIHIRSGNQVKKIKVKL